MRSRRVDKSGPALSTWLPANTRTNAGVVNPAKAVRTALQNAASLATLANRNLSTVIVGLLILWRVLGSYDYDSRHGERRRGSWQFEFQRVCSWEVKHRHYHVESFSATYCTVSFVVVMTPQGSWLFFEG